MKTKTLIAIMIAMAISVTAVIAEEETTPAKGLENLLTTQTTPDWTSAGYQDEAIASAEFPGGVLAGDIATETVNGEQLITISGEAYILLDEGHKGGVLKIKLTEIPAEPVEMTIKEYPSKLYPESVVLEVSKIELEVPKSSMYIYLNIENNRNITFSETTFIENGVTDQTDPDVLNIRSCNFANIGDFGKDK